MTNNSKSDRTTELLQTLRATRLHSAEEVVRQLEQDPERALPDQGMMAFLANLQGTINAIEAAFGRSSKK